MLKERQDLLKAKTPHVRADGLRPTTYGPGQIDALVYELSGLMEEDITIVEGA